MKLDGRIDSSQDKKDVSHQKYDRPIQAGTKRRQPRAEAATVRSGLDDSPDLKRPPKPFVANNQKSQSPSGMFAIKR
jgi:hypothetical protein